MKQRVISLHVLNEFIQGDSLTIGGAGSGQQVLFELDFRGSDLWEGTSRYVSFLDARGKNETNVMLTLEMMKSTDEDVYYVPVPRAVQEYPGEISMTLTGYVTNDEDKVIRRIVTEGAKFRVLPNDHIGWATDVIDATLAEAMQAQIDKMKDILNGHWMFLEIGEDGWLYELREDGYPVQFSMDEGHLEVYFA